MQLAGGEGYLRDHPYERALRDIRVFPIFEGANDVLRAFIALTGLRPLGEKLQELQEFEITDPIRSLGVMADYVGGRIKREVRPDRLTRARDELSSLADPVSDQVKQLAAVSEKALRKHGKDIILRQFIQKRIADAVADIYAQVAVLSRVTSIFEDQGVEVSGQERYIAETFCTRAAGRVESRAWPTGAGPTATRCSRTKPSGHSGTTGLALYVASSSRTRGSAVPNHLRRKKAGKNGHDANIRMIPTIRPPMPTKIGVWMPRIGFE